MENKRILVTGGSGFIGTNFVEHCIRQGAVVQNVDLVEPVIAAHRPHWKKISILNEAALTAAFVAFKPNYVVHLSARTDLDGKDLEAYAANILGTELVARAAVAAGCRRVVFTSTKLVNRNGYCPKDDIDYCPDTLYGESKVIGEQRLRDFAFGATDWAIVRPTSIWGPWSELPHIPYGRFFRMIETGRYFHIRGMDAKKSFGYVGNAIAQIEAVMTSSTPLNGEVFYLVDYKETYIHQWAEVIREAFGAPAIRTLPRSLAVLGARVGDLVKKLTGREMPINSRRLRNMSLDTSAVPMASIQRLCPELPYDLEKGVRETVDWFRSQ
jgi:nucleoside-diphosphate-sugar epimerase